MEVYDDSITFLNSYQGAPFQQALSGLTNLNNDWYNGKDYATYSYYYEPGASGQITWGVADEAVWKLDARSIGPNGNVGQRVIPMEPMAVVMNFGMSTGFSALNLTGIATTLPATMRFDYVRIYQPAGSTSVTCDPSGYETTEYIENHIDAYTNPNKTQWYVKPMLCYQALLMLSFQASNDTQMAEEFICHWLLINSQDVSYPKPILYSIGHSYASLDPAHTQHCITALAFSHCCMACHLCRPHIISLPPRPREHHRHAQSEIISYSTTTVVIDSLISSRQKKRALVTGSVRLDFFFFWIASAPCFFGSLLGCCVQ